jgi:hypothetical protein
VAVNRNFTDDVFNCLMAGTTPTRISLLFAIDIDVATLYLCLEESICRFGSCYLHRNRFLGHGLSVPSSFCGKPII